MGGAVGMSMVGAFLGRLPNEDTISIRKYCDIYLVCKYNPKDKKLKRTEIVADVGRNEKLALVIKTLLELKESK
jgi:hypothetical protein